MKNKYSDYVCIRPFAEAQIMVNGDVLGCCPAWVNHFKLGNLKKKSLKDIWNDEELINTLNKNFYIQNSHEKLYPPQTPGTVLVFPSFMPHGVEPVIKGIRYSIVTWMVGEYFK